MSGVSVVRSQNQDGFLYQPPEWLLDCTFVEENAAGLALGALDQNDIARVNSHVSWCPNCARLVHENRKTTGYLPFLSAAAAPSASAKTQLFDRIRLAQDQSPLATDAAGRSLSIPASSSQFAIDLPSTPVFSASSGGRNQKKRINWEVFAAPLAAVPLVVALAIVGGWALRTQGQLDDRQTQTQILQSDNEKLNQQVSMLSSSLGPASSFDFESTDSGLGGNAGGNFVPLVDDNWANLTVWDLPTSIPSYKVLIETKDGQLQQVGEFTIDEKGAGHALLELESSLDHYESVHVQPILPDDNSPANDSLGEHDILWTELNSNLGSGGGTEANANAH